jgi:hypothetical protein
MYQYPFIGSGEVVATPAVVPVTEGVETTFVTIKLYVPVSVAEE